MTRPTRTSRPRSGPAASRRSSRAASRTSSTHYRTRSTARTCATAISSCPCRASAARRRRACCCSPTASATCRSTPTCRASAPGSACSGRAPRSRSCTTTCSRSPRPGRSSSCTSTCCATAAGPATPGGRAAASARSCACARPAGRRWLPPDDRQRRPPRRRAVAGAVGGDSDPAYRAGPRRRVALSRPWKRTRLAPARPLTVKLPRTAVRPRLKPIRTRAGSDSVKRISEPCRRARRDTSRGSREPRTNRAGESQAGEPRRRRIAARARAACRRVGGLRKQRGAVDVDRRVGVGGGQALNRAEEHARGVPRRADDERAQFSSPPERSTSAPSGPRS